MRDDFFPFRKIQLEAGSLYALVASWTEMKLTVTGSKAVITGYGFTPDISWALTTLTLDWQATILLPGNGLPPGAYDLIPLGGRVFACGEERRFPLADTPVSVWVEALEGEAGSRVSDIHFP